MTNSLIKQYVMQRNVQNLFIVIFILTAGLLSTSCSDDVVNYTDSIEGLWIQEKVTEDGIVMNLPLEEQSVKLLIESNGVYRTYTKDMPTNKSSNGTWIISDNKWLDITVDKWTMAANVLNLAPANQWKKNHFRIRFSILSITDKNMEIRVKTYVGEKSFSTLFIERARPIVTKDNYDSLNGEFKTIKTYIFSFRKQ